MTPHVKAYPESFRVRLCIDRKISSEEKALPPQRETVLLYQLVWLVMW